MSDPYHNYAQQTGLQGPYTQQIGTQQIGAQPIGSGLQGPYTQQIGPGLQDPYTNYTQQTALGKRPHGQPDMTPGNRQQCLEPIATRPGETLPYSGVPSMSGVQPGMVLAEPVRQSTLPPVTTQPGLIAGDAGLPMGAGLVGAGAQSQGVFDRNKEAGTVIFRPIEGKFYKDKDIIGKMDPYCKFKIGWHRGKSSVAKGQGTTPTWGDEVTLQRKHGEQFAKLKAKDKDTVFNDRLGQCKINLDEVAAKGKVHQWYTLTKGDKVTGEVLLDIEFTPRVV